MPIITNSSNCIRRWHMLMLLLLGLALVLPVACKMQVGPMEQGYGDSPPSSQSYQTYQYRYYPDSQVYYSPEHKVWFWQESGRWQYGRNLPRNIDNGDFVNVETDTEEPYSYYNQHRSQYPPSQKKDNDFGKRHQYRYYPDSQAYYAPDRNIWYWQEYGNWRTGVNPPRSINSGGFVNVELDTEEPYSYYNQHHSQYPPGQNKDHNSDRKNRDNNFYRWNTKE